MPLFTSDEQERLYLEVKKFLYDSYEPTADLTTGIKMSTAAIFSRLQQHMPGDYYEQKDIAAWMIEGGFTTFVVGDLRTEWVMKRRNP